MATTRIPNPLTCALDAIEVILELLDADPDTTLAALVDHLPGDRQVILSIDGGEPGPWGVEELAARLQVLLEDSPGARLVLVSVRDDEGDTVAEADLAAWRRLARLHRRGPVLLLDWFVVTDDAILSLAELSGPPARWDG